MLSPIPFSFSPLNCFLSVLLLLALNLQPPLLLSNGKDKAWLNWTSSLFSGSCLESAPLGLACACPAPRFYSSFLPFWYSIASFHLLSDQPLFTLQNTTLPWQQVTFQREHLVIIFNPLQLKRTEILSCCCYGYCFVTSVPFVSDFIYGVGASFLFLSHRINTGCRAIIIVIALHQYNLA